MLRALSSVATSYPPGPRFERLTELRQEARGLYLRRSCASTKLEVNVRARVPGRRGGRCNRPGPCALLRDRPPRDHPLAEPGSAQARWGRTWAPTHLRRCTRVFAAGAGDL